MPFMSLEWDRIKPDFYRRYKWAFREEYDAYETPVVAQPELSAFIRTSAELLQVGLSTSFTYPLLQASDSLEQKDIPVPGEYVALARSVLIDLLESRNVGGWAGLWGQDRTKASNYLTLYFAKTLKLFIFA